MKSGSSSDVTVRNLDRRLRGVEQTLPTLATKLDLERFATKKDLERFATKDDLKAFPTRDEMREVVQDAVGQVRVLFEAQSHEIRLMADSLRAFLERHERLESRVDRHDETLATLDLRVRGLERPTRRGGR